MPPRGSEGYDFTPILTSYLFLFTSILAVAGWFTAFVGQAIATARHGQSAVGTLWFAIFLQMFLILGVLHTLASDSVPMHYFQISVFGAVALVFAVQGVNLGIFTGDAPLDAMGAGWLILAIVDILWLLYFTSDVHSLTMHVFETLGTGGLAPPGGRSRRQRAPSAHNAYAEYGVGGMNAMYPSKAENPRGHQSVTDVGMNGPPAGGMGQAASVDPSNSARSAGTITASSPLMGDLTNSAISATASMSPNREPVCQAKALYAYAASADDPNEISFAKGEVLDILDNQGKWWQAKKSDGILGIAPSNYLQIL